LKVMSRERAEADFLPDFFSRSLSALELAAESREFMLSVATIGRAIEACLRRSGKLIIAGNGGSAGDAQHLAAEFLSRFLIDRRPLPAVALTADTSVLTAIANDYGYQHLFERQLQGLANPGDAFLAISTSGRSQNILRALKTAQELGLITIGFSGANADQMRSLCNHFLAAPSHETAIIQQIYMVAGHAICALVERAMTAQSEAPTDAYVTEYPAA
jgi:D-sedoheptulose 7-phosphate isomerase